MNDRQLLEAAAAAAQNGAEWQAPFGMAIDSGGTIPLPWRPDSDVGDAARLMLKLKLRLDYVDDQPCIDGVLQHGMNAEEAFCRAVVRAAAEMATR